MTKVIKVGDKVRLTEDGAKVSNNVADSFGRAATAKEGGVSEVVEVDPDSRIRVAVDFSSCTFKSSDHEKAIRNDGAWWYTIGQTIELVEENAST